MDPETGNFVRPPPRSGGVQPGSAAEPEPVIVPRQLPRPNRKDRDGKGEKEKDAEKEKEKDGSSKSSKDKTTVSLLNKICHTDVSGSSSHDVTKTINAFFMKLSQQEF